MPLDSAKAAATEAVQGQTCYFCSASYHNKFRSSPRRHTKSGTGRKPDRRVAGASKRPQRRDPFLERWMAHEEPAERAACATPVHSKRLKLSGQSLPVCAL